MRKLLAIVTMITISLVGCSSQNDTSIEPIEITPMITEDINYKYDVTPYEDILTSDRYGLFDIRGNQVYSIQDLVSNNILFVESFYDYKSDGSIVEYKNSYIKVNEKYLNELDGDLILDGFMKIILNNCDRLKTLVVKGNVHHIEVSGCDNLESFAIDNVVSLDNEKNYINFSNCEKLLYATIDNIDVITDKAFYGCKSLEYFKIPDSTSYIGDKAFSMCYKLSNVVGGIKGISIHEDAFLGTVINNKDIINNLTK